MRRLVSGFLLAGLAVGACARPVLTAPPPPEGVTVGGEIRVSLPRPASLDPSNILDRSGEIVARAMCDPLLDVDRETGEYVSALLDSWVITDAGSRLVLRLRSGLRFPDGTPVTSRDAVFGLSRAASADFAGENAGRLSGIQGSAVLGGYEEADEPRHRTEFSGIRILSDVAFEVNLSFPSQVVLPVLTSPLGSPLSKVAAEADPEAFAASPVCIGPYRPVAPFDPKAPTFALERVANYPGVNEAYSGGGQGYVERITFHWSEPPTVASGTEGNAPSSTPPSVAGPAHDRWDVVDLDPVQRRAASSAASQVVSTTGPSQQYLGLPPASVELAERIALSQALDRTALAEGALQGRAVAARTFLPPSVGTRLYDPDVCGDRVPAKGDVALARATLAAAGRSLRGMTIPLVTNPDFDNVALVEAVAAQWRRAFPGLRVETDTMDWEEYRLEFGKPEGFSTGFRMSYKVPYPSIDEWLRPFWSGSIGFANAVGYTNADLDDLLNVETSAASDPVDQAVLHHEAEQLVCADLPIIPLVTEQRHFALAPGLGSATGDLADLADPLTGGLRLRELTWR